MIIKVKEILKGCSPIRTEGNKSDCFDLTLGEKVTLKKGEIFIARLGIAAKLPKGMIARVYSRSSTPRKWKVILPNSLGFIDNSYSGDDDEWKAILYALEDTVIPKGTRICQFEIKLSQFATVWQKLRWLFSNNVKIVIVESLNSKSRGGIGSTGI